MNTTNTFWTALALAAAAFALGGCAVEPTQTERNFGDSVRQTIRAQVYDPGTLSSPSQATIENSDGQRADNVLDAYRTDVSKPESTSNEVVISVDGGSR